MSLNKVQVIGYVGRDVEMRFTSSGQALSTFSVGVSNNYTNSKGERIDKTEWVSVVCWQKLAEIVAQNLTKGRQVYVEGRMETRSWDDATTGTKKYRTEVIAQQVQFLGPNPAGERSSRRSDYGEEDLEPDDLPFDN